MRRRVIAAVVAVVALCLAAVVLILTGQDSPQPAAEPTPASIGALPERQPMPEPNSVTKDEIDRCVTAGQCALVHTENFSNATVEVYQKYADLPEVHVVTTAADGAPTVWSLRDEHSASFQALTCGLANCLMTVVVGPETLATIDMRMVASQLTGMIEGAAVGPSLATTVIDLDEDGVLDLISTEHLVQADGTETFYSRTYVNDDRTLTATGCTVPSTTPMAPTSLQTRVCPAVP